MVDFARSSDPAVQHQLDRLAALTPAGDELGLERITILLDRLDRPQDAMPPVFHVAGTNGKGSTCAFLRAAIEAEAIAGRRQQGEAVELGLDCRVRRTREVGHQAACFSGAR